MEGHLLYSAIAKSTAHRPVRDRLSQLVLNDPLLFPDLIIIALNTLDKNHHKACWILELVIEVQPAWLEPYLDEFCTTLTHFINHSAIRPICKICLFITHHNSKHPGFLTGAHCKKITEACFDWLIDPDGKVATKAYAMRTLYLLGQKETWIHPQLRRVLEEDFVKYSPAYKAAAKDILRQIK